MYGGVAIALFGKESEQLLVITIPMFIVIITLFYSYHIEQIIEAAESVEESFYHLTTWYMAPEQVKKMLLIAMARQHQVTIGGFFQNDHGSLARVTEVVRGAYDFGMILIRLTSMK